MAGREKTWRFTGGRAPSDEPRQSPPESRAPDLHQPPTNGHQGGNPQMPMLCPQQPEANAHHDHEKAKLEILPAMHKAVPRPEMLRQRHCDQFNGNQQQEQTAQERTRLLPVREKASGQSFVQSSRNETTSHLNIRRFPPRIAGLRNSAALILPYLSTPPAEPSSAPHWPRAAPGSPPPETPLSPG